MLEIKFNTQLPALSILLTVKTFATLAMGNIVLSVGLSLGIAELFITPYSPRQMILSMYTMLAATALYKSEDNINLRYIYLILPGAIIGDGDRKRAPFLVLRLAP